MWTMGELNCPNIRRKISTKAIPQDCLHADKHKKMPVEKLEAKRWVQHINNIRVAAWEAIEFRRTFFIQHSFCDDDLGEVHAIRCRETGEPITIENCFFGHKIHFFDLVDEFLRSFNWDLYSDLKISRNESKNRCFADEKVKTLWLNFYKRKSEFGAQLLSKQGVYLRDQRWISKVLREGREGLFRIVFGKAGMPYRYLVGLEPLPLFEVKVVNKKLGGKGEYIGRPSPLGSPFQLECESDRPAVIAKYRAWLIEKIKEKDEPVLVELERLKGIAEATGELRLQCWCAPKMCHGDVIKEVLENFQSFI
jgi:hypothetical protein